MIITHARSRIDRDAAACDVTLSGARPRLKRSRAWELTTRYAGDDEWRRWRWRRELGRNNNNNNYIITPSLDIYIIYFLKLLFEIFTICTSIFTISIMKINMTWLVTCQYKCNMDNNFYTNSIDEPKGVGTSYYLTIVSLE